MKTEAQCSGLTLAVVPRATRVHQHAYLKLEIRGLRLYFTISCLVTLKRKKKKSEVLFWHSGVFTARMPSPSYCTALKSVNKGRLD